MNDLNAEKRPVPLPEKSPFTVRARALSFVYAYRGVKALLLREHNAWLHLVAASAAGGLGWFFGISRTEWCLVAFAVGSVLAAEAFNTAIETLADAVLLTSLAAAVVGLLVFGPKLVQLLYQFAG